MSIQVSCITKTKLELANLAETIVAHIDPNTLKNAQRPIIWSNYGSYNAGKSLLAEKAASFLSGEDIWGYFESEPGVIGFCPEMHAYMDKNDIQYQFHDIACLDERILFSRRKSVQKIAINEILQARNAGGITFLHNAPQAAREMGAALEINVRERRTFSSFFNEQARKMPAFANRSLKETGLKTAYKTALQTGDKDWIRLVQVTLHDIEVFDPAIIDKIKNFGLQADTLSIECSPHRD